MPLEIEVEKLSHLHVMSLRGRLDSAGAPALESSMKTVVETGDNRVIVDCAELRYVSSVGLGVFVASAKTLTAAGGGLYFAGLTQHVRSVFEMVGFFGLFEIYPTLQEALDSPQLRRSE